MKQSWSLAIVAAVLLSGCGAAPTAPVASSVSAAESEANLFDSMKPFASKIGRDARAGVKFDVTSITGHAEVEDRVTYSTDNGKTGTVSPLMLGKDGNLYIEQPTVTPRVYKYYRVGTYKAAGSLDAGAKLTCKLAAGGKFKSKRGLPIPMLHYSYVLLVLPSLPAAEKTEPAWVTF